MKLTARDALDLGVIDAIISEPIGGAHRDHEEMSARIQGQILDSLSELEAFAIHDLLDQRLQKFLDMGIFEESGQE
jgi:acetyl-CoA carboxylase carboxyl transferase subunit alpha